MFLALFHVFYFFGKYVYGSYFNKKTEDVKMPHITSKVSYATDPDELEDYTPLNIKFCPPVYIQRYNKVIEILNSDKYKGKIRKVVDFGCAELNFFVHLKSIPELEEILCVDVDRSVLEANKGKVKPLFSDHIHCRSKPLVVHVYEGSVTHNDKKLEKTDAVICIELIEHLYPDTLIDFEFNIFGCIKPKVVIITTPNADFNILFNKFSGFRHYDHKFEWTREQFQDWAHNIVLRYSDYQVTFHGIGNGPKGTEHLGASTQMVIFHRNSEENSSELLGVDNLFKLITLENFPFKIDKRSEKQKILDEVSYYMSRSANHDNSEGELSLKSLVSLLKEFNVTMESLKPILKEGGWSIVDHEEGPFICSSDQPNTIEDDFLDDNRSYKESETSVDYNEYTYSEDFNHFWPSENWDEELSFVIPQNNSIVEDSNTYLYDADRELSNINNPSDRENFNECSVDLSSNSISRHNDTSSHKINSYMLSDIGTASYSNVHNENNTFIKPAGKVHRTLDYHSLSVLSTSISPQPLLVHLDQLNSSYSDDTVTDKNMSCTSLLNNTFHSLDILRDESVDLEKATASNCVHFNTSSNGKESECTNFFQNEIGECYKENVTELKQVNMEKNNIDYEDHFVLEDCASASSTNQPQYTSSPRVVTKTKETSFSHKSSEFDNVSKSNISKTLKLVNQRILSNDVVSICQTSPKNFNNTNVSSISSLPMNDSYNTIIKCDKTESELIILSKKDNLENMSSDKITSNNDISVEISNLNSKILTSERDHAIITQESNIKAIDNINKNKRKLFSVKTYSSLPAYPSTADPLYEENAFKSFQFTSLPNTDKSDKKKCISLPCAKENSDLILQSEKTENVNSIQSETCKDYPNSFIAKGIKCSANIVEIKPNSPDPLETPPNSWSPEIMDSGYPNTASAQDMTPEYDLSSIAHDQIPDSESPSVAEAPQFAYPEPVIIENGDLANNNRDGEGNNMIAVADNDIENLQPLINVLENDLENENDIYVVENGFPVWLLRILEMANPIDIDGHILRDHRELIPFDFIEGDAEYLGIDHDEGFDRNSSIGDSDQNKDEISSNISDANHIDYNNEVMCDTDSDESNNLENIVHVHYTNRNADSDEWEIENT
ncbi:PREDICTED: uncharacterized protein LOC106788923 [Polistes canadensis]|uniref:uncharacterized protein LOC106788923 n=1 Tax=Polistes canadensis TaxID=91411 RepID=UPI000718CFA3|nr:PREDICTED: uncharacterized protein LOC106788923 [Polistes canadensis]